jgi:hypothetical protein
MRRLLASSTARSLFLGTKAREAPSARGGAIEFYVERLVHFRNRAYVSGWAFHPVSQIQVLEYQLAGKKPRRVPGWKRPSPDVERVHGSAAANCRFDFEFVEYDPRIAQEVRLIFTLRDGSRLELSEILREVMGNDPYQQLVHGFFNKLQQMDWAVVLEIGSRNRSGFMRRDKAHSAARYVGFDVLSGENVDVVGDAHNISKLLDHNQFDMVFSISTFEHLAMPWKAAVEINRVMKVGGLLLVSTHQTWPLHEEPWDFWRFSDHSWDALFNSYTGFEVVETAMGEPGSIVPHLLHAPVVGMPNDRARLASAVICRKIGDPRVDWDVQVSDILDTAYPI